jgi:hypothetical protein
MLIERDRGHRGARNAPDKWAGLCGQRLDAAPLGHEYFELAPLGLRVALVEGHHFCLGSRTAAISFRFWIIMLSRVMISQPRAATCGIQSCRARQES